MNHEHSYDAPGFPVDILVNPNGSTVLYFETWEQLLAKGLTSANSQIAQLRKRDLS
jgi:hypothetical protein